MSDETRESNCWTGRDDAERRLLSSGWTSHPGGRWRCVNRGVSTETNFAGAVDIQRRRDIANRPKKRVAELEADRDTARAERDSAIRHLRKWHPPAVCMLGRSHDCDTCTFIVAVDARMDRP